MITTAHPSLGEQIAQWRGYLLSRRAISEPDVEELDAHLRDEVGALARVGLTDDEAFLVAVKRMGSIDALSREFAREHSERLWKQLVLVPDEAVARRTSETFVVLFFSLLAAMAVKAPELFGLRLLGGDAPFYARNASLFALPLVTAYFGWKRGVNIVTGLRLALIFGIAAIFANVYPFRTGGYTETLTAVHLPIVLWLAVGFAYAGSRGFVGDARMDFVRFSGELFIYYVLIGMGGAVLTGFTVMMFNAIGLDSQWLARGWLMPCGAAGAVLVGSWLVEAKQSIVENMAPVLTRLFTPLFTVVLLVFLGTMIWTGSPIDVKREVLIGFDLLLVLVVGLVLYAVSSRDPTAPPDLFDRFQCVLVVSALLVDAVALTSIASKISEFGFTPNRVAALGENFILLVNLAWSAVLYARFLLGRGPFSALERWQTAYLPVYSIWAALVVVGFPPLFTYV